MYALDKRFDLCLRFYTIKNTVEYGGKNRQLSHTNVSLLSMLSVSLEMRKPVRINA